MTLADSTSRLEVRLHLQPHDDAVAAVAHALQPIGVFTGDRGGGDFRRVRVRIASAPVCGSAVRAGRSTGPARPRRRAAPRATRPLTRNCTRLVVARERHVEDDDAPPRLAPLSLRARANPRTTRAPRPGCRRAACRHCRRGRASRWCAAPARRSRRTRGRAPSCGTITFSVCTFSRPSRFISPTAQRIARSSACGSAQAVAEAIGHHGKPLPCKVTRGGLGNQSIRRRPIPMDPLRHRCGLGARRPDRQNEQQQDEKSSHQNP